MPRKYTAQEMRELADSDEFEACLYDDPKRCPDPDFAEDDITPMVKDMLRQAADMMEREEKREREFEYIVRFFRHGKCVDRYSGHYDTIDEAKLNNTFCMRGDVRKIFRREVGKWEEVEDA